MKRERFWVKVSGMDRITRCGPPCEDAQPFARTLVAEFGDRVVWGNEVRQQGGHRQAPAASAEAGATAALDPAVDAGFHGRRAARVEVELRDGRRFTHVQPDRKGDPQLSLTDADLEGKLLKLASPVIGDAEARARLGRIWSLHQSAALT